MIFPAARYEQLVRTAIAMINADETDMVCHIAQSSFPLDHVEILEAEPGVAVILVTTPAGF